MEKYIKGRNDILINKIALNSKAGGGKDTFGDYLVENYGFKKITFAEGIYDIAYKYFGMTYKNREILQQIGQKMREIDPLIWVKYAFEQAEQYEKVIITDVRQSNEYSWALNKKGYLPVHIDAKLDLRIKRLEERDGFYPDLSLLENESETGADNLPYITVDNNSTFENLYLQIDDIMKFDWTEVIKDFQMEFDMRQRY